MSLNNARHVVLGSLVTTPPIPVLPEKTIRCKFTSGYTPTMGDTQTLVDAQENIWDIYKNSTLWIGLFQNVTELVEVVAANIATVEGMSRLFEYCSNLVLLPQTLNTDATSDISRMFYSCSSLKAIPTFSSIAHVIYINAVAYDCTAVESGALALYQQASSLATIPASHAGCFVNCGRDAPSSAPIHAEMQQIPSSWGGNGA